MVSALASTLKGAKIGFMKCRPMSALGRKRTCAVQNGYVRFVPKADIRKRPVFDEMCTYTRGNPAISNPSPSRDIKATVKGQACLASVTVKLGSFRIR